MTKVSWASMGASHHPVKLSEHQKSGNEDIFVYQTLALVLLFLPAGFER